MVLHFFPYKSKHHLKAKIEEFSKLNPLDDKRFVLYGADKKLPLSLELGTIEKELIYCSGWFDIFRIFLKYGRMKDNKLILHGYSIVFLVLSALSFFRAKKMWVVWGSGMYHKKDNFKRTIEFYLKRFLYNRLHKINCMLIGDAKILKNKFEVRPDKVFLIPYKLRPHKIFSGEEISVKMRKPVTEILVGNQANRHHNHIQILKLLSKFKDENIMIHLFLNYPKNEVYVKEIMEEGMNIFKDKINFITEMLTPHEYLDVMKRIHITILDVEKQTGLAAIYKTIDYGGVVFLSKVGLNKEWLDYLNIKSKSIEEINLMESIGELNFLSLEERLQNIDKRIAYFDIERIRKEWTHFLND